MDRDTHITCGSHRTRDARPPISGGDGVSAVEPRSTSLSIPLNRSRTRRPTAAAFALWGLLRQCHRLGGSPVCTSGWGSGQEWRAEVHGMTPSTEVPRRDWRVSTRSPCHRSLFETLARSVYPDTLCNGHATDPQASGNGGRMMAKLVVTFSRQHRRFEQSSDRRALLPKDGLCTQERGWSCSRGHHARACALLSGPQEGTTLTLGSW